MTFTQSQLGERIKTMREGADFTQDFVASYLRIPRPSFLQIEKGERKIDSFELKRLADLFKIEMADFFSVAAPAKREAQKSAPSVALLRGPVSETAKAAVSDMEKILNDYFYLLEVAKENSKYFKYEQAEDTVHNIRPGDYKSLDNQASRLAENRRRLIGIEQAPIQDIFDLLDNEDIFIVRKAYDDDRFSGCFLYKPEQKLAAILINSKQSELRQRFSAAHEYGHFLCHRGKAAHALFRDSGLLAVVDQSAEFSKKNIDEQFVDLFAKSFLVPKPALELFLDRLRNNGEPIELEAAVRAQLHFGVSKPCILNCLQNYGLITAGERREFESKEKLWKEALSRFGYRNHRTEIVFPSRYKEIALKAYQKKEIGMSKLAELLHVSVPEAQDQLKNSEYENNNRR